MGVSKKPLLLHEAAVMLFSVLFSLIPQRASDPHFFEPDRIKLYDISKPTDTIVYRKIGQMYPSINYAHLRIGIDFADVKNASEEVCRLRDITRRYKRWGKNESWTGAKLNEEQQDVANNLAHQGFNISDFPSFWTSASFGVFGYVSLYCKHT